MTGGRGQRYDRMTPEQQREIDERDVAILDMLADGWSYKQIETALDVTAPTIGRVKRDCLL